MEYIQDGDTVQVGKGALVMLSVSIWKPRRDITIYTEIISDWVVTLAEKGVLKSS